MFEFRVGDSLYIKDEKVEDVMTIVKEMVKQGFKPYSNSLMDGDFGGMPCLYLDRDKDIMRDDYKLSLAVRDLGVPEVLSELTPMSKLKTSHEALQALLKQREELDKKIADAKSEIEEVVKNVNEALPDGYRVSFEEGFVEGDIPAGSVWEYVGTSLIGVSRGSLYTVKVDGYGDPVFYDDDNEYRGPGKEYFLENFKRVK